MTGQPAKSALYKLTSFEHFLMWTAFCFSSSLSVIFAQWMAGPEGARAGLCLIAVSCLFFHSPRGKRMGKSNKQSLCFHPVFICSGTARRPAKFSSSSPPLPLPPAPLAPSRFSSLLIRALANTKGGWEAESWLHSAMNEDKRAEVKAEEEDLRSGVGVVVISQTRLRALCHQVTASWGRGVACFAFALLGFFPSLMVSMKALCELEEGCEVPFGCHWHGKECGGDSWRDQWPVISWGCRIDSYPTVWE